MSRTVVGLFDSLTETQHAVNDLMDAGFKRDDISLVANDARNEYAKYLRPGTLHSTDDAVTADEGAGFGAVVGGLTGILASLGALAIPGIGPVIAAGPLVAALTGGTIGAVAGAATGGIVAGLVKTGVSEDDAQAYAEGIRQGGTLLVVNSPDSMAQRAQDIMNRHGAVDVYERMTNWRSSGWKGFDANAGPYTAAKSTQTTNRMTDKSKTPAAEEQVNLREERVVVERRPADRLTDTSNAFKETSAAHDFDTLSNDFRTHYNTHYGTSGRYTYDQYMPAYRYGYELASNHNYKDWNSIENDVRTRWEERNKGTWEDFKDAIRYAWDKVRGKDTAQMGR